MEKSPAFQFYPKDWLTDEKVVAMTHSEQGQYFTLLCLDWLNDGLNLSLNPALNGGSTLVRSCFVQHPTKDGYVTNPRLLKEREKQEAWREKSSAAGKESGKVRRIKALQNEPNANQRPTKAQPKTNSPSSSSSSSSSINTPLPPKGFENQDANKALTLWIEYRGQIGKKLRPATVQQLIRKYSGIPNEFITCVTHSIEQGYQGLFMPKENGSAPGNFKTKDQLEREDWDRITAKQIELGKKEGLL